MSTKCTLSFDKENKLKYHLYQECYDNDNVWLQLDEAECFEIQRDETGKTQIRLAIPVEIFRHMLAGWEASEWCKNPGLDHHRVTEADLKQGIEALKEIAAKRKSAT
jgi:hypothetical protein